MKLEFSEWTPDMIGAVSSVVDAKNVIPDMDGFRSFRDAAAKTSALNAACLGAGWFADDANNPQTFAGTTSKLYKRNGDTWTDVSKVGGYTGSNWEFVKWGSWCVATNGVESPQYMVMSGAGPFANVTNAPIAFRVAVIRDFLVFGDTNESATSYYNRVRWSGFNNATAYGSSLATQADYQDLLGNGGRVQKIVSGDVGVIFQERSIWTMEYVGPPTIFRFVEVEPGQGTPAPGSVCQKGGVIYYLSHAGFMAFSGGQSAPIGAGKIDKWFNDNVDTTRLDEIRGVVDREGRYVYWSFASSSAGATCDSMMIFHIPSGKWAYARVNTEVIFEAASPGYTLDGLDSLFADIDSESIAVDSRAYLGGAILLGCFDSSHKLATFDGDALTAEIETGDMGSGPRFWAQSMRPLVEAGDTITVCVGYRNDLTENVTWGAALSPVSTGDIPCRVNARYQRFKMSISGGFTRAHGLEVDGTSEGSR